MARAAAVRHGSDVDADPVDPQHGGVGLSFEHPLELGRRQTELLLAVIPAAEGVRASLQATVLAEEPESRQMGDSRQGGHQRSTDWWITPTKGVSAASDPEACAQS